MWSLTGIVLVLCSRPRKCLSRVIQQVRNGSSSKEQTSCLRDDALGLLDHTAILSDVSPAQRAALAAASTCFLHLCPLPSISSSTPHHSYLPHSVFSCSDTLKIHFWDLTSHTSLLVCALSQSLSLWDHVMNFNTLLVLHLNGAFPVRIYTSKLTMGRMWHCPSPTCTWTGHLWGGLDGSWLKRRVSSLGMP